MREIKFRAFNKELRKMVYPDARGWYDRVIRSKKNGVLNTITVQLLILGDYPEVELLQYTGLKDKNGVEIYEGDIVNCSSGCPHKVYWEEEYAGTYVGGMPAWYLSGINTGYAWSGEEEIVGNIYENPELLEVPK